MKYAKRLFAVIAICIFVYFAVGESFLQSDVPDNGYACEKYKGSWTLIREDGTRTPIKIPSKCKAKKNELVTIETTLPNRIDENLVFCFRSAKQEMQIYVDKELRQEYSTKEERLFGRTSAVAYVFLDVSPDDAGKTIRVETKTDSSYSGIFYTIYVGNRMGIWHHYFSQYGIELAVAFLTIILSICVIIASTVLRLCLYEKSELEYLGWGVLIAGVWLVTNSMFRQLMFSNVSVINDMAFLCVILLPLPFMIFIDKVQKGRYRKAYQIITVLVGIDFLACTFLHVTNMVDYTDTIVYMVLVCFATVFTLGISITFDIIKGYIKDYRFVAIGILGASVSAGIQAIMYFRRTTLFTGSILAIGLIFLLIFATVDVVYSILDLDREKKKAFLSNESKGRFLANMSHEIRTPINAVLGMDAMILRESTEPQIKEYALDIQNAGQSLLAIINDILDFSKIESGKMEIVPAEYDFSSMIHDIINMISIKAEVKGLKVSLSLDESLPSRLWGDDVRIRQVLVNILNNAVKYTNEGSVELSVTGRLQEDCVLLRFVVEDTGIGIKEEDIEKLFAEFERIEDNRNRYVEGTGLGMSITTSLLALMGSSLQVESVFGSGSKFSFELEQKIMDADPIGNLEERIRQQAKGYSYQVDFTAPTAKVLVVDDNAVNRKVFVNLLKATKVQIDEAAGGFECLEKVSQKEYDIIFLDHMMPDLDGIETFRRMQKSEECLCKDTPIIALTANAITGAREMYMSEGFDGFLPKPVNPEKLEETILEYLPRGMINYTQITGTAIESEKTKKELKRSDLPDLEGIDWEYALLHTGDINILMQTVKDVYSMIEIDADDLDEFYNQIFANANDEGPSEALNQYRIKVHAMKNSVAMIGDVSLSGVAKMLEFAARDEKLDVIKNITPIFLNDWRQLKEILKPCILVEESTKQQWDGNKDMMLEYLRLLEAAMEDMDIDTADEIMVQLKRFEYPTPIQESIDTLDIAVVNLDPLQTSECIDKLKEKIKE